MCSPDVGVEDVADFEVDGPVGPHEQVARGLLDPRRRARRRRGRRPHDGPRRVHPPAAGDPRAGRARVPAASRRKASGDCRLRPPAPLLARRVCGKNQGRTGAVWHGSSLSSSV